MLPAQRSLNNFYQSVKFYNPSLAALMGDDMVTVALHAISEDNIGGQPAAERLRQQTIQFDLPEVMCRMLDNALTELGY